MYICLCHTHTLNYIPFMNSGSAVRALNFDEHQDQSTSDKNIMLYVQLGSGNDYCALPSGTSLQQIVETVWYSVCDLRKFCSLVYTSQAVSKQISRLVYLCK